MVNFKLWMRHSFPPRTMVGSYRVKHEIGRGSMGVVYLGKCSRSGRDVALKTMAISRNNHPTTLTDIKLRFIREATILTWLDHPDIVTIHDAGEHEGLAYIAMEFLKGSGLSAHIKPDNLLSVPQTLEIVARAADALGHAHEQNVTHRDIKPANIMYHAPSNMVKVMDFGVSRLANFSTTQHGVVLGSPLYMSPEQVRGGHIDGRSDLFSLGSTLYQLLCGRAPFEGGSEMEVMRRIAETSHLDILSVRPDLPAQLGGIVDRALGKDVNARYQTGYEMAAALRQCAAAMNQGR